MKHLAALLFLVAAATTASAHGRNRVVLGGVLSYTAQGHADAAMIEMGVGMFASTVSAIAYDGCQRSSV